MCIRDRFVPFAEGIDGTDAKFAASATDHPARSRLQHMLLEHIVGIDIPVIPLIGNTFAYAYFIEDPRRIFSSAIDKRSETACLLYTSSLMRSTKSVMICVR